MSFDFQPLNVSFSRIFVNPPSSVVFLLFYPKIFLKKNLYACTGTHTCTQNYLLINSLSIFFHYSISFIKVEIIFTFVREYINSVQDVVYHIEDASYRFHKLWAIIISFEINSIRGMKVHGHNQKVSTSNCMQTLTLNATLPIIFSHIYYLIYFTFFSLFASLFLLVF